MYNKSEEKAPTKQSFFGEITSCLFGVVFLAIGMINTFWGNDPGYGIFIALLSSVYFPPTTDLIRKVAGITIGWIIKVLLGLFILWSALGVAELFDKIDLMRKDLANLSPDITLTTWYWVGGGSFKS